MARPRYNAHDIPARERIIQSFWNLLEEMPHHKITVSLITKHAGVNRNTFYYHFETLEDLSYSAVDALLHPKLIEMLLSGLLNSEVVPKIPFQDMTEQRRRIALLTGEHGSPQLSSLLRRRMRQTWCETTGIKEEKITETDDLLIEFALSGMMTVIVPRLATSENIEDTFRNIYSTGLPSYLTGHLYEIAKRSRGETE